jgi:hypothetical protein
MHPKIKQFVDLLKASSFQNVIDQKSLNILKENGATSTEAMITIHLGFLVPEVEAEKVVLASNLWERESIQDIAYQTFLYMNYNPEDPNFQFDENKVRFSLFPPSINKDINSNE